VQSATSTHATTTQPHANDGRRSFTFTAICIPVARPVTHRRRSFANGDPQDVGRS
jgi:hypothetical protein